MAYYRASFKQDSFKGLLAYWGFRLKGLFLGLFLVTLSQAATDKAQLLFDPPPGTYPQPLYIRITSPYDGRLYYATTDTVVRDETHLYKGVIKLENPGKIALKIVQENLLGEEKFYGPYLYTVLPPDSSKSAVPLAEPPGGIYEGARSVFISHPPNQKILWSLGDSTNLQPYTGAKIEVNVSTTLYFCIDYGQGKISPLFKENYILALGDPKVRLLTKERSFRFEPTLDLELENAVRAVYTLDPFAPLTSFMHAGEAITLSEGRHQLRLAAINLAGRASEIQTYQITVDKTPPVTRYTVDLQKAEVRLFSSEAGAIFYSTDGSAPGLASTRYLAPLPLKPNATMLIRFLAIDTLGNLSSIKAFTASSDTSGPKVQMYPPPGTYRGKIDLRYTCSEPCVYRYSLDGTAPALSPRKLTGIQNSLTLEGDGTYILRYLARDLAGNHSAQEDLQYIIDTKPPTLSYSIRRIPDSSRYQLIVQTSELATVYVSTQGTASISSPRFRPEQSFAAGERVSLVAVDSLGNVSPPLEITEISKPRVVFQPPGGIYNKPLSIHLSQSEIQNGGSVFYEIEGPRQTKSTQLGAWKLFRDSLKLDYTGHYTIRARTDSALTGSVIEEQSYIIDPQAPRIVPVLLPEQTGKQIRLRFDSDEPARINYTLDGSLPGPTSPTLGNPYVQEPLFLTLERSVRVLLKYRASDRAGNQTPVYELDLLSPHVRVNPPPGFFREIIRVELSSQPGNLIFFSYDSTTLSQKSAVYTEPLVVQKTDTLWYFAMDQAGFSGPKQKAVFSLDLPPEPNFSVLPATLYQGQKALFDAALTADEESPPGTLQYRWDFDGDGSYDVPFSAQTQQFFTYTSAREFEVTLEVKDSRGQVEKYTRNIPVRRPCPSDMVLVVLPTETFCIDRYEWPNQAGATPLTGVNWAQAASYCHEKGRNLCKAESWESACKGPWNLAYSYGNQYKDQKCAVKQKQVESSGKYKECQNEWGAFDMVGNVWEWVDGYTDSHYVLMGGGFAQERSATCGLTFPGRIETQDADIGFRCCL